MTIARYANKEENEPTVKRKTDNKNHPLGNPDIRFSREFKTAVFNSVLRTEQKYGPNELTYKESHKINKN